MAMALVGTHPLLVARFQAKFEAAAIAAGFQPNWQALLVWAEKWVPTLFWPALLDVVAGNWAALFMLAVQQGPACVTELLAALGVGAPGPVVMP